MKRCSVSISGLGSKRPLSGGMKGSNEHSPGQRGRKKPGRPASRLPSACRALLVVLKPPGPIVGSRAAGQAWPPGARGIAISPELAASQ